jgi:hypothetical protein
MENPAMCQRITCRQCGKPSFSGCGRHVEAVLGDVPRDQRCQGHDAPTPKAGTGEAPSVLERVRDFLAGPRDARKP